MLRFSFAHSNLQLDAVMAECSLKLKRLLMQTARRSWMCVIWTDLAFGQASSGERTNQRKIS